MPDGLLHLAPGTLVQARICRSKKRTHCGEEGAAEIGDVLPFLEYEVHRQLIGKLKLRGLNALFCFRMQISVGENMIVGVGTGTGLCLAALPVPPPMQFLEAIDEQQTTAEVDVQTSCSPPTRCTAHRSSSVAPICSAPGLCATPTATNCRPILTTSSKPPRYEHMHGRGA